MVPIALTCKNAFILKPSKQDPSTNLMIAHLLKKTNLPNGIFSIVHNNKKTINAILHHPKIATINFVNSTPITRYIYKTNTSTNKRVQTLNSTKNHTIVLPDTNLNLTTNNLISTTYSSTKQRCIAISITITVNNVTEPLLKKIKKQITKLKINPNTDPSSKINPLISKTHLTKISNLINTNIKKNATLRINNHNLTVKNHKNNYFITPTVFNNIKPNMHIYNKKIFNPMLIVVRTNSYPKTIQLVNNNPYKNNATIFTYDGSTTQRFEQKITTNMVSVNVPIPMPMAYHSFNN